MDSVGASIGLLALFGRRIAPAVLIEIQADPVDLPHTTAQEDHANTPPTAEQEDPANTSLTTSQEDLTDTSSTTPQQQILPALVPYEVDETESSCSSFVSFDST